MSAYEIETPEERRARYLRLARAATEAAAKTPLHGAKGMYVRLAEAWLTMADENDQDLSVSYETGIDVPPPRHGLHRKLKEMP